MLFHLENSSKLSRSLLLLSPVMVNKTRKSYSLSSSMVLMRISIESRRNQRLMLRIGSWVGEIKNWSKWRKLAGNNTGAETTVLLLICSKDSTGVLLCVLIAPRYISLSDIRFNYAAKPRDVQVSITFDPFMYVTTNLPINKKWSGKIIFVPLDPASPRVSVRLPSEYTWL